MEKAFGRRSQAELTTRSLPDDDIFGSRAPIKFEHSDTKLKLSVYCDTSLELPYFFICKKRVNKWAYYSNASCGDSKQFVPTLSNSFPTLFHLSI